MIFTGLTGKNRSPEDIYLVLIVIGGSYIVERTNGNRVLTLLNGITGRVSQLLINALYSTYSVRIHLDRLELIHIEASMIRAQLSRQSI